MFQLSRATYLWSSAYSNLLKQTMGHIQLKLTVREKCDVVFKNMITCLPDLPIIPVVR